jgi:hypothetical protein
MILLNEVAKSGAFMVVYKDHADDRLFYYIPRFAELATRNNGDLLFGHQLFRRDVNKPDDGFSVYNFTVRSVMPGQEFKNTKDELEAMAGGTVTIVPVPGFELSAEPITDLSFMQVGGKVQTRGGNIFTDLGVSMTFAEWCEPDMANLFMKNNGWTGQINYKLTGLLTPFEAKITVNWFAVQEHFRSQISVKYWFVSANISYETQKLIENGTIKVEVLGGTPEDKEKVWALANKIAERLFVRAIQPNPLPGHPSGSAVCFSLNFSRTEENRTVQFTFTSRELETRNLGMAIVVGNVPRSYFSHLGSPMPLTDDLFLSDQIDFDLNAKGLNIL